MTNPESSLSSPNAAPTHVRSHEAVIEQEQNRERAINNFRILERLGGVGLSGANAEDQSALQEANHRLTERLGPSE